MCTENLHKRINELEEENAELKFCLSNVSGSNLGKLAEEFKKYTDKILETGEGTSKFLKDVGIHNEKGELTKRYAGNG